MSNVPDQAQASVPGLTRSPARPALTERQRQWVENQAPIVFGLTASQTKMLLLALDADAFSFQEIATAAQVTREGARLALRSLERRSLIRMRPFKATLPRWPLVAEPGEALLALFDRLL